ncbi:MAG: type II toxin-antitoxin system RelE/ParE family toxin [Candidatus Binatia bacterium]
MAERDVENAVVHYLEEGGPELSVRFIAALETALRRSGIQPAIGSPRYAAELALPGLRVWPLRRFPHLIFYVERQDCVDVWRVLHAQRDIPAWLREDE